MLTRSKLHKPHPPSHSTECRIDRHLFIQSYSNTFKVWSEFLYICMNRLWSEMQDKERKFQKWYIQATINTHTVVKIINEECEQRKKKLLHLKSEKCSCLHSDVLFVIFFFPIITPSTCSDWGTMEGTLFRISVSQFWVSGFKLWCGAYCGEFAPGACARVDFHDVLRHVRIIEDCKLRVWKVVCLFSRCLEINLQQIQCLPHISPSQIGQTQAHLRLDGWIQYVDWTTPVNKCLSCL